MGSFPTPQNQYRIFVSYAHEDSAQHDELCRYLHRLWDEGCVWVNSDVDFQPGVDFEEQITKGIGCAHALIPLITENSINRPWVQQEIAYAMALNVPIVPVAVCSALPQGLPQRIQSAVISKSLKIELPKKLSPRMIESVIQKSQENPLAVYQCAPLVGDRAKTIAKYSHWVEDRGFHGRVRQRGAVSSFGLPDVSHHDEKAWERVEGNDRRTVDVRRDRREERRMLAKHANAQGCDLMLSPLSDPQLRGQGAQVARMQELVKFLGSIPQGVEVRVVLAHHQQPGNLLIVGNWFVAESLAALHGGYRQTLFTWHAPTVLKRIEEFDEELKRHTLHSRDSAISILEQFIAYLEG